MIQCGLSQPEVVYAVRKGERIANKRGVKLKNCFNYLISLVPFIMAAIFMAALRLEASACHVPAIS